MTLAFANRTMGMGRPNAPFAAGCLVVFTWCACVPWPTPSRESFPSHPRVVSLAAEASSSPSCLPEIARIVRLIAKYLQSLLQEPAVNVSRAPHFDCSDAALVTALQTDGFAVVRHRFGCASGTTA